ncbi:MAG: twin-arginine translocation signal domain-containing protein, partial [Limisphaerales bacterium]
MHSQPPTPPLPAPVSRRSFLKGSSVAVVGAAGTRV